MTLTIRNHDVFFFILSRLSKIFIDKAKEELKSKGKSDEEKGILEKLLEINEEYALIMATDMLLAGVDTVNKRTF